MESGFLNNYLLRCRRQRNNTVCVWGGGGGLANQLLRVTCFVCLLLPVYTGSTIRPHQSGPRTSGTPDGHRCKLHHRFNDTLLVRRLTRGSSVVYRTPQWPQSANATMLRSLDGDAISHSTMLRLRRPQRIRPRQGRTGPGLLAPGSSTEPSQWATLSLVVLVNCTQPILILCAGWRPNP